MASSSPYLSDDTHGVCIVEPVDSEDVTCPEQKPPNPTKIDEDSSLSSNVDAAKIDTKAIPCQPESLAFEKFISACTPRLKTKGKDEKILKKLRKHYAKLNLEFRQLNTFSVELEKLTLQMSTHNVYDVIEETLCYLKSCRKKSACKKQAHIKKLEKILWLCDEKIKKLQEKEVDFDQEVNSTYMRECRYKEHFAFVYKKLCDVVGCSARDPKPKVDYNGTRFPEINGNITRYLRKKEEFPDFKDILEIIAETNEQAKLLMSEEQISRMARQVFEEVGAKLKKRRIDEFESTLGCSLTDKAKEEDAKDPALVDTDLREKLENNQKLAKIRLDELMETFVVKQESKGEEEAAASNTGEEDGDDEEEDGGHDDDQQEMEEFDEDRILLIEIEDSPSETEESEVNQKTDLFSIGRNSPLGKGVIPKIEPSEPSKNGFLSGLDTEPTISILAKTLATSHSSKAGGKFFTASRRGSTSAPQSHRNPLQSAKRRLNDEDEFGVIQAKKRILLQTVVNDDDVIVLSD